MVLSGFEISCWNGDLVRLAFIIDAHDREIIAWHAVANAGIAAAWFATYAGGR
jgi:hypothetical protein